MKFNPADNIQDLQYFGEFGGVNPSISDSSTYTFLSAKTMFDTFEGNMEGCYLYSRHSSPSNLYLDKALAAMEGTETANVSASGMGAITPTLMQLCGAGDHIVSSRTIYGGTYAFLKNFAPRFGVKTGSCRYCRLVKNCQKTQFDIGSRQYLFTFVRFSGKIWCRYSDSQLDQVHQRKQRYRRRRDLRLARFHQSAERRQQWR